MKLNKVLCLILVMLGVFSFSFSEAKNIKEVWKCKAQWRLYCSPGPPELVEPTYILVEMQFIFHVEGQEDFKGLEGKGEGRYLTDKLVVKYGGCTSIWHHKVKTFSIDITGIKENDYFLLDFSPSPSNQDLVDFWELKCPGITSEVPADCVWGNISWGTISQPGGFRIEAKDGATAKIQEQVQGILIVEGDIKIIKIEEKEECITTIDSIYGDVTLNGKKIENLYFSGKTRIKTGEAASIELSLPDGSTMKIGSDTDLEFNAECSGNRPEQIAISEYIKLFLGKLWIIIAKPHPKSFFNIETPTCAMGIRGTKFSVEVRKTEGIMETMVEVEEGEIEVKELKTNKIYIVKAGEKIKI